MNSISVGDMPAEKINEMLDFCHAQDLDLVSFEILDVSDVSGRWDTIATFKFGNDKDAVIFKLKL